MSVKLLSLTGGREKVNCRDIKVWPFLRDKARRKWLLIVFFESYREQPVAGLKSKIGGKLARHGPFYCREGPKFQFFGPIFGTLKMAIFRSKSGVRETEILDPRGNKMARDGRVFHLFWI